MLLKTRFVRCFCSVLFGIRDSFSICRTVNPVPAPPQGGGRTGQEQLWLDARASTEEGVRFGGWNELATNGAFAPPAAPQIGCLWRKRNAAQTTCPTTSRHSVIPGRNNRRTCCREQLN